MECLLFLLSLTAFIILFVLVFKDLIAYIAAIKSERTFRNLYIQFKKQEYDKLMDEKDREDWAEYEAQRTEDWLWS